MHLFHKWSKWEDKDTRTIYAMDRSIHISLSEKYAYLFGIETRQERRCSVCNALQRRLVTA